MEDCPVFTFNSAPGTCELENALPAEIASENVKGPRKDLPNDIQIQAGPERASPPAGSSSGRRPDAEAEKPAKIPEQTPKNTAPVQKIPTVPVLNPKAPRPSRDAAAAEYDSPAMHIADQSYPASPAPTKPAPAKTLEPSLSIVTSVRAPTPTSAPVDQPPVALQAGGNNKAITTSFWTSGREAHEVIVVLEEVTVTADGGKVTQTAAAAEAAGYRKRQYQHQHHHQHAARGIGGRKMKG